jgi:hypothetical protein
MSEVNLLVSIVPSAMGKRCWGRECEGGEEIASQFACENGSGHLSCRVKTFDFPPIISQPSLLTT